MPSRRSRIAPQISIVSHRIRAPPTRRAHAPVTSSVVTTRALVRFIPMEMDFASLGTAGRAGAATRSSPTRWTRPASISVAWANPPAAHTGTPGSRSGASPTNPDRAPPISRRTIAAQ